MTLPLHPHMLASAHACRRAKERFGADPSAADWAEVVLAITDTILGIRVAAVMTQRWEAGGRERWLVSLRGVETSVIWDPHNQPQIVTVMPRGWGHWSPSLTYRPAEKPAQAFDGPGAATLPATRPRAVTPQQTPTAGHASGHGASPPHPWVLPTVGANTARRGARHS